MRFRNTLILALLVVALGAYLLLVERPAVEKEAEKGRLVEFDRERAARLVLEYPERRIELTRDGGAWKIVSPGEMEADQAAVKNLIDAIGDAELKKTVDAQPASLAPFGLEQPVVVARLTLEDGTVVPALSVGKTTPVGHSAYARRGEEPAVLLTTSTFHAGLKKDVKDLRDKTILPLQDDAVREIRIQGAPGEPETVLVKEGDGWSLTKPVVVKADAGQVRSYLSTLRAMRALDFVDEVQSPPDSKYGLTPPRLTVTALVGEDRAERKLLVGGPTGIADKKEIYVERGTGGPIFTVGEYLQTSLAKKPIDFRDKTILAFEKDKVETVVVTRAGEDPFTLQRKDGKWILADPGEGNPKDLIIERFVEDIRTLKGADLAAEPGRPGDFGLEQPTIRLDLEAADGSSVGSVLAARQGEGAEKKLFAAAAGAKTIYTLNEYVFQRIDKRAKDFLEPVGSPSPAADASLDLIHEGEEE